MGTTTTTTLQRAPSWQGRAQRRQEQHRDINIKAAALTTTTKPPTPPSKPSSSRAISTILSSSKPAKSPPHHLAPLAVTPPRKACDGCDPLRGLENSMRRPVGRRRRSSAPELKPIV